MKQEHREGYTIRLVFGSFHKHKQTWDVDNDWSPSSKPSVACVRGVLHIVQVINWQPTYTSYKDSTRRPKKIFGKKKKQKLTYQ